MQIDVSMDRELERNFSLKFNLTFKCFALEEFGSDNEDGPYGTFSWVYPGGRVIRLTNL